MAEQQSWAWGLPKSSLPLPHSLYCSWLLFGVVYWIGGLKSKVTSHISSLIIYSFNKQGLQQHVEEPYTTTTTWHLILLLVASCWMAYNSSTSIGCKSANLVALVSLARIVQADLIGVEIRTAGSSLHPLHSQMFLEVSDCFHSTLSSWSSITECGDFALWLIAVSHLNCSALRLLVREILLGGWGGESLSQVYWTMGGIWSAQREHGNTTHNQDHCCSEITVFCVFHVK